MKLYPEKNQHFNVRHLLGATALSCALFAAPALANEALLKLSAQPVDVALLSLAEQASVQIMFEPGLVQNIQVPAVSGAMSVETALARLLKGSGLGYEKISEKVFVVRRGNVGNFQRVGFNTTASYEASLGVYEGDERADEVDAFELDEIVVTAQKRAQSINDVAMSITAVSDQLIARRNLVGMEDYLRSIPGVSLMSQGAGYNSIVMRGLAINAQLDGLNSGPITGVYFGDTPISSLGIQGNSADIKLVDMERIEVLKGPQGTLYGAGAMGGVVRNIPKAPNLEEFEGSIKVGYSNTARLGSGNSDVEAVVNVPLIEDQLAVRAVVYRHENSGYYRNVAGLDPISIAAAEDFGGSAIIHDDIGKNTYTGGRFSTLWQPNDRLSVSLNFLRQKIKQNGWAQSDIGQGGYNQSRLQVRAGTNGVDAGAPINNERLADDVTIAQATIEYDLGWGTLSSSTSFIDEDTEFLRSLNLGFPWSQNIFYSGESLVEELRLSSSLDGPLQFIFGYYYEDRESGFKALSFLGGNELDLNPLGGSFDFRQFKFLKHHALFGEVNYELSEQFKITFGARGFDQTRTSTTAFEVDAPAVNPDRFEIGAQDVSMKAGVDYTPNDDVLVYALWSQGFRLGDVQPLIAPAIRSSGGCDDNNDGFADILPDVSLDTRSIDSDSVNNYELGGKFSLMDGRVQVNASVYQIDWTDIPVLLPVCGGLTVNAGEARSRGVEFETSYHVGNGFLLDLAASYVNAELTKSDTVLGQKGDRLPGSPEYTVSLGLEYDFVIGGNDAYVRSDVSYIGGYFFDLQGTGPEMGDYTKIDVTAGVRLGQFNLSLFARNLTNRDNLTSVNSELASLGFSGVRLQPRTVGVRLGYDF